VKTSHQSRHLGLKLWLSVDFCSNYIEDVQIRLHYGSRPTSLSSPTSPDRLSFNMSKETMRAVVFKGPHKVAIEDRPVPKIKDPGDIIVKVDFTALCGR